MYKRWARQGNRHGVQYYVGLLRRAKTWQLVILLVLLGVIAATFLRLNNLHMIDLRNQVEAADKAGDHDQTKASLVKLQSYVSSHMNTGLGKGVSLSETYKRDYDAALKKASNGSNPNSDVYQQAAIDCRARFQGGVASFRNDYVTCVANAVASLPQQQQNSAALPNPDAYRYDFVPPLLSLDVAGFFVVVWIGLAAVILLRLTLVYGLKLVLKKRLTQH